MTKKNVGAVGISVFSLLAALAVPVWALVGDNSGESVPPRVERREEIQERREERKEQFEERKDLPGFLRD